MGLFTEAKEEINFRREVSDSERIHDECEKIIIKKKDVFLYKVLAPGKRVALHDD